MYTHKSEGLKFTFMSAQLIHSGGSKGNVSLAFLTTLRWMPSILNVLVIFSHCQNTKPNIHNIMDEINLHHGCRRFSRWSTSFKAETSWQKILSSQQWRIHSGQSCQRRYYKPVIYPRSCFFYYSDTQQCSLLISLASQVDKIKFNQGNE